MAVTIQARRDECLDGDLLGQAISRPAQRDDQGFEPHQRRPHSDERSEAKTPQGNRPNPGGQG